MTVAYLPGVNEASPVSTDGPRSTSANWSGAPGAEKVCRCRTTFSVSDWAVTVRARAVSIGSGTAALAESAVVAVVVVCDESVEEQALSKAREARMAGTRMAVGR